MTKVVMLSAALCALVGFTSCSSTKLEGSIPIPFTDPAVNASLDVDVTPLPPKLCVGLDITPRSEEDDAE